MLGLVQDLDWANRTNVSAVGLVFLATCMAGILLLPRRWAPATLLAVACFVPAGQRLVVLTLDFSFLRLLVLFGWLRIVIRKEISGNDVRSIDLVLIAWSLAGLVIYSLCRGTPEALIFKLGATFDAVGIYFLLRFLVKDWSDLRHIGLSLSLLAIPVCGAFLLERASGHNWFSVFGGVPELTAVREGRLRCQGAFGHPILAGCYWAAALPLIAAGWWARGTARVWAVIGSACALTIIVLTASSTPVMAACVALLGGFAFWLRRFMRVGILAAAATVVTLHLVMNAPVWHLIARLDFVAGSTGWYRFYLLDQAINRFDEWWLLGTPSTTHWGPGLSDVTNQYVLEAVRGGLLGVLLFLTLAVLGFRCIDRAWRSAWPRRENVALAWALGVSLLAQCTSFFGVAYFDQTWILWFLVLACSASLSRGSRAEPTRTGVPRASTSQRRDLLRPTASQA